MKQNEYQSKFDQLLDLVDEADKGVTDAKKLVEKAESKKYRAEKALENFVSHTFIRCLKELFGTAKVAIDVFPDDNHRLPPMDEPTKFGCFILPTKLQSKRNAFVNGMYASICPVKKQFIEVRHGKFPAFATWKIYFPSYDNTMFMPKRCNYYRSRHMPIGSFKELKSYLDKAYDAAMKTLKKDIDNFLKSCKDTAVWCCTYGHLVELHSRTLSLAFDKSSADGIEVRVCARYPVPRKNEPPVTLSWYEEPQKTTLSVKQVNQKLKQIITKNEAYYKTFIKKAKEWYKKL